MNTTILATALLLFAASATAQDLEIATPEPPTQAALIAAQAKRIAKHYDKMILSVEYSIREMRGFKSRFDPTLAEVQRKPGPKQYWFRSLEHKRDEIAKLEASLAAMRDTRWASAIPYQIEATWYEMRVGEICLPTDYSTNAAVPIRATIVGDEDEAGRIEAELQWPEYFAAGDVDQRRIYLVGTGLKLGDKLKMPLLWVTGIATDLPAKRFVCEYATQEHLDALDREIRRLTHPDRKPRRWADATGEHQIDATLASYDRKAGIVRLERADKTIATLPIAKLSPADRELVELTLGSRITARAALTLAGRDPE